MTTPQRDARSPITQYSIWLNLVSRLLDSNCLFNIEVEGNKCLIPIPWKSNETLSIPYGRADIPFLKRLLFSSDRLMICKSLQALVERAYDCYKAMDMLRLDVLSPLNRLTRHAEPFVRQRCCVLIRVLAGQPLGKMSVVRNAALVRRVLALAADPEYAVRFHCAAAVMALAEHRLGNEAMVALGCAERVLDRLRAEQDGRVVPALLRAVGRLTATGRAQGGRCRAAEIASLAAATVAGPSWPSGGPRNGATAGALLDCGGGGGGCGGGRVGGGDDDDDRDGSWIGRGVLEYLTRGARSADYRTAADSVACLSRAAATMREANEHLARDRDTVDLLVSFARSPRLRGRALRSFSAQLLCAVARTAVGLANLRAAAVDWTPDADADAEEEEEEEEEDAEADDRRHLARLARVLRPASDGRASPPSSSATVV